VEAGTLRHIQSIRMDYSQEGRNLVAGLLSKYGLGGQDMWGGYHKMDPVYQADTGGVIYVGGWDAAEDLAGLEAAGITTVINCTTDLGCPHTGRLHYLKFDISWWQRHTNYKVENIPGFIQPVLHTVETVLGRGESVLVHCLAGAHRAGTTGTLLLMHFLGKDSRQALLEARAKRSIINPIGDFPEFLKKCDSLPRNSKGKFVL